MMNQMERFLGKTYSIMNIPIVHKPKLLRRDMFRKEMHESTSNNFGGEFIGAIAEGNWFVMIKPNR